MSAKIFWTPEEDEFLRTWYGKVPASMIGEKVGRTADAVTHRVARLGISTGRPGRWSYAREPIEAEIKRQISVQTTNLPPGIRSVIRHSLIG